MFEELLHNLHVWLADIAHFVIYFFEYIGIAVIAITGIRSLVSYISRKKDTTLILLKGMATGLAFLTGGEILATLILTEIGDVLMVGGTIILRVALIILIHWEVGNETKHSHDH